MAEFPYLPIWTDAYLADTRHLTTEEHGAYLLLMMEAWRRPTCSLPDDDRLLARLAGVSADKWDEIKPVVMAFWKQDGRSKTWTQKRLISERQKSEVRSQKASDSAAKRWKKNKNGHATAKRRQSSKNAHHNHIYSPLTPQGGEDFLDSLAERIRGAPGQTYLFTNVTDAQCREMCARKLITQDELRAVGLSA